MKRTVPSDDAINRVWADQVATEKRDKSWSRIFDKLSTYEKLPTADGLKDLKGEIQSWGIALVELDRIRRGE